MAAAVRAKHTTAGALLTEALDAIAAHDPRLNAFTAVFEQRARETARRVDEAIAAGVRPRRSWPFHAIAPE